MEWNQYTPPTNNFVVGVGGGGCNRKVCITSSKVKTNITSLQLWMLPSWLIHNKHYQLQVVQGQQCHNIIVGSLQTFQYQDVKMLFHQKRNSHSGDRIFVHLNMIWYQDAMLPVQQSSIWGCNKLLCILIQVSELHWSYRKKCSWGIFMVYISYNLTYGIPVILSINYSATAARLHNFNTATFNVC